MTALRIPATQVPAMVGAHQDFLRGNTYQQFAGKFFYRALQLAREKNPHAAKVTQEEADEYGMFWCEEERARLNISQLFHITESMTEVAKFAAEKLDEDAAITVDILPSRCGVLVFERPIHMLDAWLHQMGVCAVTWYVDAHGEICFQHYSDIEDPEDAYNKTLRLAKSVAVSRALGRWSLAHVGGNPNRLGEWIDNDSPEMRQYRETHIDAALADDLELGLEPGGDKALIGTVPMFANFTAILLAIFSLMDQTIVQLSEETDRRLARRWKGKRRPPTAVTVIALRRKEYHGYHEKGTGTWLTYRSVTRGHWRQQPYGPGRQAVKRIWINPYIRGGEDLPFYQPPRVSTLAR